MEYASGLIDLIALTGTVMNNHVQMFPDGYILINIAATSGDLIELFMCFILPAKLYNRNLIVSRLVSKIICLSRKAKLQTGIIGIILRYLIREKLISNSSFFF